MIGEEFYILLFELATLLFEVGFTCYALWHLMRDALNNEMNLNFYWKLFKHVFASHLLNKINNAFESFKPICTLNVILFYELSAYVFQVFVNLCYYYLVICEVVCSFSHISVSSFLILAPNIF